MAGMLLCASATLQAQTTIKPGAGINISNFSKDPANGEVSGKTGWQLGGTVAFGKKFYFEPGLFYVGRSTEFVTTGSSAQNVTLDLKGFRIPVGVGINVLGNEKTLVSLRGFGGASAFFITSKSGVPATVDIKSTDFGLYAGAGLDFWKLFIDASYEWSVTNIQENVNQIDIGQARNFWLTAGLRINL